MLGFKDEKVNNRLYYLYGRKPYDMEIELIKVVTLLSIKAEYYAFISCLGVA